MDLDFYDRSIQYAQDVVEGKVVVGEYIKQACERFLLDLTKDDWRWHFDRKKANHVCAFPAAFTKQ